ncbi:MAG: hypothetical protein IT335_08665 [Thermomicrobiales bacterium]|jgi:hypothetical protein|nr:hypothetical protein [Thermomicrobiales bacterium]
MSADQNGSAPDRELRIVIIGRSIRADWQNPRALTHRALVRALIDRGHDVVFLEERRNDAVIGQMKAEGSASVLAFDESHPDIRYRSYDPPLPRELGVWLGFESSTADLMILLLDAPPALPDVYARLQAPHVVRLHEVDGEDGSRLVDTTTGAVVAQYHPLAAAGASSVATAVEAAWRAAGIRM